MSIPSLGIAARHGLEVIFVTGKTCNPCIPATEHEVDNVPVVSGGAVIHFLQDQQTSTPMKGIRRVVAAQWLSTCVVDKYKFDFEISREKYNEA
jgi:hypothetical protein